MASRPKSGGKAIRLCEDARAIRAAPVDAARIRLPGTAGFATAVGRAFCALAIAAGVAAAAAAPAVREFRVPTRRAFPHDPAVDRAGRVYFTEMAANKIGRFDPATSAFDEFEVPTRNSGPHGIVAGPDGWVTFTEIRGGKIGRLDPERRVFHEFPTPGAADPHTPALTADGRIFFTAAEANVIGELNPSSGAVTTFAVPTAQAVPYGIKPGPDGALYFTEFGSNKIGRFDPATRRIKEFVTPTAHSAPRRLWFHGSDLFFTEYAAGKLGRLRLGDRSFTEWPSPGGPDSRPYALAIDGKGRLWYAETATGAMISFDPEQGKFTATMRLPSINAVVRNMDLAPDGRIWMALSGADRIGVIEESP